MEEFKDWPIALLIASLFLICIVGFSVGIGKNYGKEDTVMTTEYIDLSRIELEVNKTSQSAENWGEAFKSDNLFVSAGAIVLFSIWGLLKLIWGTIITFVTIYLDLFSNLFGIPPIVTGTITAIVIISLIFLAWKTVKQGN